MLLGRYFKLLTKSLTPHTLSNKVIARNNQHLLPKPQRRQLTDQYIAQEEDQEQKLRDFNHERASWAIQNFEDRLFDFLSDSNEKLSVQKFKATLNKFGLRESDPRLKETMDNLNNIQHQMDHSHFCDRETFKDCIADNIVLIAKAFHNKFVIPDFTKFREEIDSIYWVAKNNNSGKVANYIPQLSRYSPDYWGISICTVDGQRHSIGDCQEPFCLQSASKPLVYALVQEELDQETVHQYVGHEPSGVHFNAISLDLAGKPHNPMVNSGAIATCSLLKNKYNLADRFDYATKMFKKLTGGEYLTFNNSVFLSERETADRNFALGYYMRENKCFPEGTNLMETMDFYFQLCSIEVNCDSAAVMAATLANGGVCPTTGESVFSSNSVRNTLSLMHSCGMYDYSGGFAFEVGLPAKSGVSGCILLVVPNVMGICMWSPPLDKYGNSVRGIQFCKNLVEKFNFHNYDSLIYSPKKYDPRIKKGESKARVVVNLLFGAYNGDITALRRYALIGTDMNIGDYDGRTALHVGAAEGNETVVKFLLEKCKVNPSPKDRWGFTPLDDAVRFGHKEVEMILKNYIGDKSASNMTVHSDMDEESQHSIQSKAAGE